MKYSLVKKGTAQPVYSDHYNGLIKAYNQTGFFLFLVEAFLYCRENQYELPEELLTNLDEIFKQISEASDKSAGLSALGFDTEKWQGDEVKKKWADNQILVLCDDYFSLTKMTRNQVFSRVAEECEVSKQYVRNLYINREVK